MTLNFSGRHYPKEIILQSLRYYLAYKLSYREIEEIFAEQTLYNWRNQAREQDQPVPGKKSTPDQWSHETKFAVVVETALHILMHRDHSIRCFSRQLSPQLYFFA